MEITGSERPFLNIAAYTFAEIPGERLPDLRSSVYAACAEHGARGTVLLSVEGVNLALCGRGSRIRSLQEVVQSFPELDDLDFKESWSKEYTFNRLLVKIKKEIIPLGVSGLDESRPAAPYIQPTELRSWLDKRHDVVLLDMRNDYEINVGTFANARSLDLSSFRSLPEQLATLGDEAKSRPIVTFCTGGIRCEKGTRIMIEQGFEEVYQLEGGILRYFEECGDAHYVGECFVFDKRVAVDGNLLESETSQCYQCRHVLTPDDRLSDRYTYGVSCPYCAE